METDRYNAIIVGAGPAGSAAAIRLAQNDLSVALIERGERPGTKTMFGGSIYVEPTSRVIPEFWKDAPLERPLVTDEFWLLDRDSAVKVGFTGLKYKRSPYNKFSALRSKFDPWFAQQAVNEGAHLMTSTLVTDLVYEKTGLLSKKVAGVKLDSGEVIHADVVLLAEGASANLTEKAGLRGEIEKSSMFLYAKEELALPAEKIEARFNLEPDEGTNVGMIGYPTSGVAGKGGLWTNKESISLIVGGYLNQIIKKGVNPYQMISRFKAHPLVSRLIKGAETVAYKSRIIPKGGYESLPQLYDDGILVAGDAAVMISGRRGTDLAMLTGLYAADIIAQARAAEDHTSRILKGYEKKVMNSFFMKNIKKGKGGHKYQKEHPDTDYLLTKAANDAAYKFFKVGSKSSSEKMKKIRKEILDMQPVKKTVKDLYYALQDWSVF